MAYQKNTWASGDVVTSAKLNNIENGIAGGGVLIVNAEVDMQAMKVVLDKTYNEIISASLAVVPMISGPDAPVFLLYLEHYEPDHLNLIFTSLGSAPQANTFTAISADDYPFMPMG